MSITFSTQYTVLNGGDTMSAHKKTKIIVIPHCEGKEDFYELMKRVITDDIKRKLAAQNKS